jgi:hypothetical protein
LLERVVAKAFVEEMGVNARVSVCAFANATQTVSASVNGNENKNGN